MTAAGAIFDTECAACHPGGELLRGRAVELYESRDGRTYLVRFMLSGEIRSVSGGTESFAAGHPSFKHLSDQSIADVINFMLRAWGNDALSAEEPPLYDASEVESSR